MTEASPSSAPPFGERIHQMLRTRAQGGFERAAVDGDRFVNAIAGFGKPVDQTAAVAVERPLIVSRRARRGADRVLAAPLQVERAKARWSRAGGRSFLPPGGE
ncbi:MAG: hypothetical protein H6871_04490 [Methylobacteriaceae bacterium]|nr:hypothetical protein [Methylobacteriaceae bacterium]